MPTGPNDNDIIDSVLTGDQQAYTLLVDKYKSFVFTMAFRYTKNREDAEEVSQDIFVKAYRALADFRKESKFSTWLYTITSTTCITFLRKKKLEIHSLDNEKIFDIADSQDSGLRANMEQKSKAIMVNKAIRLLKSDDAAIITLFYKAEQTLEEIAKALGIDANTAKVRLHRARTRLKDKMQTHFAEEIRDL
jgi:RNA polymerase sigma factor (sigma-70 family)